MLRKFLCFLILVQLILVIPISAEVITPDYIVDLSTQAGFDAYKAEVNKDMYPIGVTEGTGYTTHGMYIEYKDANGNGTGEFRWTVDYTFNSEDKCMSFVGKPEELATEQRTDLRLTIPTDFDPVKYPYLVICYRITDKAVISTNNIYVRDNKSHPEYSATAKTWVANALKSNGQWNYRILDFSKELSGLDGNCMGIRIPICADTGNKFDVKYVAAFATKEQAQAFDIAAFEAYQATITPAPTEEPAETPDNDTEPESKSNVLTTILFVGLSIVLIVAVLALYRFLSKKI